MNYNWNDQAWNEVQYSGEVLMRLPTLAPEALKRINPDGGFLCFWTHWRPDPDAPGPEEQGQKLMSITFLPCPPDAPCLCGSGKLFQDCCRPQPYMPFICRNPGVETIFSRFRSQTATFSKVDGEALREKLTADKRLVDIEDNPERGFWTIGATPTWKPKKAFCVSGTSNSNATGPWSLPP